MIKLLAILGTLVLGLPAYANDLVKGECFIWTTTDIQLGILVNGQPIKVINPDRECYAFNGLLCLALSNQWSNIDPVWRYSPLDPWHDLKLSDELTLEEREKFRCGTDGKAYIIRE